MNARLPQPQTRFTHLMILLVKRAPVLFQTVFHARLIPGSGLANARNAHLSISILAQNADHAAQSLTHVWNAITMRRVNLFAQNAPSRMSSKMKTKDAIFVRLKFLTVNNA